MAKTVKGTEHTALTKDSGVSKHRARSSSFPSRTQKQFLGFFCLLREDVLGVLVLHDGFLSKKKCFISYFDPHVYAINLVQPSSARDHLS